MPDKIIVLDNGRVREEGKHLELLAMPGSLYRELWTIQEDLDHLENELKDQQEL